jgi:predicted MFS family arabinose efflux permease
MDAKSPRSEWASGWPLVLSCAVGISGPSVALYSLGQFMAPLEHEFGWTRTEVSVGLSISLIVGVLMSPVIGRLVDLVNARTLVLIGCVLGGLGTATLSLANGDTNLWIWLWVVKTASTVLIGPVVWIAVIPAVFKRGPSMAVAMSLTGQSLAAMFAPVVSRYLISAYGWRLAYDFLALFWYGSMFALALFFFFDKRERAVRQPAATHGERTRETSVWAVFRSPTFLKVAFVAFALKTATLGDLVHLAPALVDKGFGTMHAAEIAGAAGAAAVCGKLGVAWLFDHLSIFKVSAILMSVFAVACVLLLLLDGQLWWALAACAFLGATDGGLLTALASLSARLFRPQEFGVVFGAMCSAMAVSTAAGPMLASMAHDRYGSYSVIYWAGLAVAAVCLFLLKSVHAPTAPSIAGA